MANKILVLIFALLLNPMHAMADGAAESYDIDVLISSRLGTNLIGVLPDRSTVLIACKKGFFSTSATMYFTNDDDEFTITSKYTQERTVTTLEQSVNRPLSNEDAASICSVAAGRFIFKIDSEVASIKSRSSVTARIDQMSR